MLKALQTHFKRTSTNSALRWFLSRTRSFLATIGESCRWVVMAKIAPFLSALKIFFPGGKSVIACICAGMLPLTFS